MRDFLDISHFLGMPDQASAHAADIDFMMALVHWLMLLLFVGWGGFFIYTLIRFRQSRQPKAIFEGTAAKWSKFQEGGVVLFESVLLVGFAFPLWGSLKHDFPVADDNPFEVNVVAEQFAWNVHYPGPDGEFGNRKPELVDVVSNPLGIDPDDPAAEDDLFTVNELHLPVNRPVVVTLTSKDVIHSFGIPQLRIKQDAIPGLQIPIWFMPTVAGHYEIACAQLCGLSHYRMRGQVVVESQAEVDSHFVELAEFSSF
jgi:cytochrome c oxidase subunit 2